MENTIKLKPCKFCGGLRRIRTVPFDSEDYGLSIADITALIDFERRGGSR